jgi:hypothetical protein
MIYGTWIEIRGSDDSYRLMLPPNWIRQEDEDGTVSLVPRSGNVAITISVARHRNRFHRADAGAQLMGFLNNLDLESHEVLSRAQSVASARCVETDGWQWLIIALAKGNTVTIISLNGAVQCDSDSEAWDEGVTILQSVS